MKARVTVTLKTGVLDPQGKAIEGALASLGIGGIASVRQGKLFDIELADGEDGSVEAALKQACERLLANTVIENYRVEVDGATQPARPAGQPSGMSGAEEFATDQAIPAQPAAAPPQSAPPPAAPPQPPAAPSPPVAQPDAPSRPVPPPLPSAAASVDPSAATEIAARDADMPTEGHP